MAYSGNICGKIMEKGDDLMQANLADKDYKGKSFEIIDGQVYMMSPVRFTHAIVAGNIYRIFSNYLKGKKCIAIPDGVKVEVTNIDNGNKNSLVPDCMIVCDRSKIKNDLIAGAPDLAVEVLSKSTMKIDRTIKKDAYENIGVKEYWIVSASDKFIERYLLVDGKYDLENVYYLDEDYENFADDEGTVLPITKIKVSLYDDLYVDLEDVFNF